MIFCLAHTLRALHICVLWFMIFPKFVGLNYSHDENKKLSRRILQNNKSGCWEYNRDKQSWKLWQLAFVECDLRIQTEVLRRLIFDNYLILENWCVWLSCSTHERGFEEIKVMKVLFATIFITTIINYSNCFGLRKGISHTNYFLCYRMWLEPDTDLALLRLNSLFLSNIIHKSLIFKPIIYRMTKI